MDYRMITGMRLRSRKASWTIGRRQLKTIWATLCLIIFIPFPIGHSIFQLENPSLSELILKFSNHPGLSLSIINVESSRNPLAVSSKGAMGLMQVMPQVWEKKLIQAGIIRHRDDLFDPVCNIRAGEFILAEYKKQHKGNLKKALKAHSGGDPRYPNKVLAQHKKGDRM